VADGLGRLRGGEELFVRGSDRQARMLGAFSYTQRRGE
jgi:hypothetical protein